MNDQSTRTTHAPAEVVPDNHHDRSPQAGTPAPPRSKVGVVLRRIGAAALVVLIAVALVAAGGRWHEQFAHWFGGHEHAEQAAVSAAGNQLWTCGMHPQVIRDKPGICPICHMKLTPLSAGGGDATMAGAGGEKKVKYWWDPMIGPASISDKPGKSAMGMDLVPVYEDQLSGGAAVTIDPVVVQNMGVRIAEVTKGPVRQAIRAVGYLDVAQPKIHDVNLRVSGWIEKLYADIVGMHLKKGDKLFELYSPEVQVAVEELIAARRAGASIGADADDVARRTTETLLQSTRQKLELWGLSPRQINELAALDRAPRTVTFFSPIVGHLTEKLVVDGASVKAGDRVLRIIDHSLLWLESQVYGQDMPFIKLGQKVTATVDTAPGREIEGEVIFIAPHLDPATRTATVRIALPNPELTLRPGMYATAQIVAELAGDALLAPREAVIDTGTRQIAFVSTGEGRFEPRKVKAGVSSIDGMIQILEGLAPGEQVVTSGQFLLDAESRMREAIQKHLDDRLLARNGNGVAAVATADLVPATAPMSDEMKSNAAVPVDPGTQSSTTRAAVPAGLKWSIDVDAAFVPYLKMANALGAAKPPQSPLNVEPLTIAAQKLVDVTPPDAQAHARNVLTAAIALKGQSLPEQRKLFAPLSEAVIAMAEVCPPSNAVADKLYVMFCPMKKARWLQTSPDVANPYYATEMKQCGEVQQKIEPAAVAKAAK
ncbi:MAG: efflux RND transporter periplasmic adaptor subunit [Tepidisphaeraceae bacterium]